MAYEENCDDQYAWIEINKFFRKIRLDNYSDSKELFWRNCFYDDEDIRVCLDSITHEGYRHACDIEMSPGDKCIYRNEQVTILEIEIFSELVVMLTMITNNGEIDRGLLYIDDYIMYTLESLKLFYHPDIHLKDKKNANI